VRLLCRFRFRLVQMDVVGGIASGRRSAQAHLVKLREVVVVRTWM
jgi:hypothetical protein